MKAWILSDLHLELEHAEDDFGWFPGQRRPQVDADVVVLAGDIHRGARSVTWAARTFPDHPVIIVPGNHEFYRRHLFATIKQMREAANGTHVTVLDNDVANLAGVRFLGATLWTSFELYGAAQFHTAVREAQRVMIDFELIRYGGGERFTPYHAARLHEASRRWLATQLAQPFEGNTVVVTHHLPSKSSIHPKYEGNLVNAAFASHLDDLMKQSTAPALWIHGHTHASCDYVLGNTRVICNPRGYVGWDLNRAFRSDLVVEV